MKRLLGALAVVLAGCADSSSGSLKLLGISPDNALEGVGVQILILGERLTPRAFTDFDDRKGSRIEASYAAQLGTTSLRNVRLDAQGQLRALVPEGIPPGTYDLKVTDPYQREGVLAGAFRIVSFQQLDALIAGYRVEPLDAQRVFNPFALTVTAIDAQGTEVKQFNGSVSLEDLTASLVPKAAGAFAFGRWTGKVEVRAPHLADVITVRDGQGRTGSSNPFVVGTSSPAALRFATVGRDAVADACSLPLTVELRDGIGVVSAAEREVALALTPSPSTGFTLFTDAACTTPLTGARIAKGASRLSFHFKGTQVGSIALEASSPGLLSDTQVQRVVPAASARLAFVSSPQTASAGSCSAGVVIQAQDAFGNPARLAVVTPVALTSGLALFSDPSCTTSATSVELPIGVGTQAFFFRGTIAKSYLVEATSAGLLGALQTQTVIPAAADRLVFTSPPQTQYVGACSSLARCETRDRFDNPSPVPSALAVALAVAPSGLALFSDPSCTQSASSVAIAANSFSGGFHFKGSAVGTHTVTVSAGTLTPASQLQTIELAPADRLVFLSAPQTLVAGTCSAALEVQAQDMNGVPVKVGATTLVRLGGTAGLTFYASPSCTTAVTSVSMAATTDAVSFYFRTTVAGQPRVTAEVTGWMAGNQTQAILPGPRDRLAFVTSPHTVAANVCSPAVSLGLVDGFANATTSNTALGVNLSASPPGGFSVYSDSGCNAAVASTTLGAGASSTTVYFRGSQAAQITLSASATGVGSANQDQVVKPGAPVSLVFLTPPRTLQAGGCSGGLTVQTQDAFGNPSVVSSSTPLTLAATPQAGFAFYSDGSCTLQVAGGTFAAGVDAVSFYSRGTAAGPVQVTATAMGLSASQNQTVLPGPTSQLVFDAIASPQLQRVPFSIALRARDAYGNPTPGFSGIAALQSFPSGAVSPGATGTFTAGTWTGTIGLDTPGTARRVDAAAGAITGISNAFEVAATPARSPPSARVFATPAAVVIGQPVSFSAASSSDYQTAVAALEVSWDFSGLAPGGPPWSAWSTSKTISTTWPAAGLYEVRVAVRDPDGDVGYAAAVVKVVASASELCVVTTNALADDGATSCDGPHGPDGALSITEAVRLANAGANLTITFPGPMVLQGAGRLVLTAPMSILGSSGVSLRLPLDVQAAVRVSGLELTGASSASTIGTGGALTLTHVVQRDGAGWINRGAAAFLDVQMTGCAGDCLTDEGGSALNISHSVFGRSPGSGVVLSVCGAAAAGVDLQSATFWGLDTGVKALCARPMSVLHCTFDQNQRALVYVGSAGQILRNNLFTRHSGQAVTCGTASFTARDYGLLFQNAADGCVAADPNGLTGDPLFLVPAARDYRLSSGSPAVDSAIDVGRDLNGPGPGAFFGSGPDRGAGESR